jgi:hypothetical protein
MQEQGKSLVVSAFSIHSYVGIVQTGLKIFGNI